MIFGGFWDDFAWFWGVLACFGRLFDVFWFAFLLIVGFSREESQVDFGLLVRGFFLY